MLTCNIDVIDKLLKRMGGRIVVNHRGNLPANYEQEPAVDH